MTALEPFLVDVPDDVLSDLAERVIGPLADPPDPSDAFHLVVPSLPGYGFSAPTSEAGWNPRRIAAAFGEVADRLGYQRYGV